MYIVFCYMYFTKNVQNYYIFFIYARILGKIIFFFVIYGSFEYPHKTRKKAHIAARFPFSSHFLNSFT